MNIIEQIKESVSNILHSKMQSFLAILGVLVGTGSVVALISSSQLATQHALAQFKTLGTNLLSASIQSGGQGGSGGQDSQSARKLQLSQMPQLEQSSKDVLRIAPYVSIYKNMDYQGKPIQGTILGATGAFADIAKVGVSKGRFVSYLDKYSFYCVIGHNVAKLIRNQGKDPIGQQIHVGDDLFTVIGIAKPWKPNLFIYADIDNGVIIPLESSYILSKYAHIDNILFRIAPNADLKKVQDDLQFKLNSLIPGQQIQFRNPGQIIAIVGKQRATFTWLLVAIGSISLVVGGIGVMNIMLVSVIERRQEIGVRMAIGAQRSDILYMFLVESVFLTLIGGLLGVIGGVLVSLILAEASKWEFHLYFEPVLLGFAVSFFVGILSGIYPAMNASRLDPVATLYGE